MQMITIQRIENLWSHKLKIFSTTYDAERLLNYFPRVQAVSADNRKAYFDNRLISERISRLLPYQIKIKTEEFCTYLQKNQPLIRNLLIRSKKKRNYYNEVENYWSAIRQTDVFVLSGAGAINDEFETHALSILDAFEIAKRLKIKTAMFGQGIGPVNSPKLLKRCENVLKHIDFIGIREQKNSLNFLNNCGVSADKIYITGDDAIELAFNSRKSNLGSKIGINLRVADYSNVNKDEVELLISIIKNKSKKYSKGLIPIPISFQSGQISDYEILKRQVEYQEFVEEDNLKTPQHIIDRISECRIVITGSYHGAVFALAQGISVICLAKSQYYLDKFHGLLDMFSTGGEVLSLTDEDFPLRLEIALERWWSQSMEVRSILLDRAKIQINLSKQAYENFYKFCSKQS